MKNLLILLIIVFVINCAKNKEVVKKEEIFKKEILVESYPVVKPDWIFNEPEFEGDYLCFTGISNKMATEKDARKAAERIWSFFERNKPKPPEGESSRVNQDKEGSDVKTIHGRKLDRNR